MGKQRAGENLSHQRMRGLLAKVEMASRFIHYFHMLYLGGNDAGYETHPVSSLLTFQPSLSLPSTR